MSNTASSSASPAGSTDPAPTRRSADSSTPTAVEELAHTDSEDDGERRCPSCDAVDTWRTSRRHRFSPFGSVTLITLAFWAAVVGGLAGIGMVPAVVLALSGVAMAMFTRGAEVCQACGYVRPKGRP